MTAERQRLVSVLFVDCGEGREIKHGDRAGQIVYTRQPRAKFECLLCQTLEGPVTGPAAVRKFVETIRDHHKTTCRPTHPTQQGAQAA